MTSETNIENDLIDYSALAFEEDTNLTLKESILIWALIIFAFCLMLWGLYEYCTNYQTSVQHAQTSTKPVLQKHI